MSESIVDLATPRPSPWDRLVAVLGPLTAGQRWTAALACGATALFLTAGMPGERTAADGSVQGSLDGPALAAASSTTAAAGTAVPSAARFASDIDDAAPTDAATFFDDPSAGRGVSPEPLEGSEPPPDPLEGSDPAPDPLEGSEPSGPSEPSEPTDGEPADPAPAPKPLPVPLPVPLPAL